MGAWIIVGPTVGITAGFDVNRHEGADDQLIAIREPTIVAHTEISLNYVHAR